MRRREAGRSACPSGVQRKVPARLRGPAAASRVRREAFAVEQAVEVGARLPPSARRQKLERYLEEVLEPALPVLPYDGQAAEWHAAERARLTRAGQMPAFVDGQIAAVAAINGLALATLNLQHFRSFRGLEVEAIRSSAGDQTAP